MFVYVSLVDDLPLDIVHHFTVQNILHVGLCERLFLLLCVISQFQTTLQLNNYPNRDAISYLTWNHYFPALIPPSFTSLNPFETFFRRLQPHFYVNSGFNFVLSVIYRKCSHAKQAMHTKSISFWMSEENFQKELSRITLYRLYYITKALLLS